MRRDPVSGELPVFWCAGCGSGPLHPDCTCVAAGVRWCRSCEAGGGLLVAGTAASSADSEQSWAVGDCVEALRGRREIHRVTVCGRHILPAEWRCGCGWRFAAPGALAKYSKLEPTCMGCRGVRRVGRGADSACAS